MKVKYMTKGLLAEAMKKQDEWGYNRQLDPRGVRRVTNPQAEDTKYPVTLLLVHHHKHGQQTDPHYRCMVVLESSMLSFGLIDMPIDFYELLPEQEVNGGKGQKA